MNGPETTSPLDEFLKEENPAALWQEYAEVTAALGARIGAPPDKAAAEIERQLRAAVLEEDDEVQRWLCLRSAVKDWQDHGVLAPPISSQDP